MQTHSFHLGGFVVLFLGHRTCDQQVASSSPGRACR